MTGALNQRLRPLGHATNLNEALNGLFFLHLQVLMTVALHLLMNLSFDPSLREEMITLGYLPKLVAQLGQYVNVHIVQDEILARNFIIIGRFGYLKNQKLCHTPIKAITYFFCPTEWFFQIELIIK